MGPSGGGPEADGHSTCHSSGPALRRSPAAVATTGTRAAAAVRRTTAACAAGSSRAVV
ncbi:hypothetical protein M2167_004713 [Streptomyces sp. SPB4]|nr:hypothetical protein [Streptomyces sp. SPB4]